MVGAYSWVFRRMDLGFWLLVVCWSDKLDEIAITSSLGFSYLTIHVNSTKTALERLKKAGVQVLAKGPALIPGTKVALTVVKDPDGNFVELVGPANHQ